MIIPADLQKSIPRNLADAGEVFAKNKKLIRSLFLGGAVVPFLVVVICYLLFGDDDLFVYGIIGMGIGTFIEFMGFAMYKNKKKLEDLYVNGILTEGKIVKVTAPGDKNSNTYVFIDVEFKDKLGSLLSGKATTIGNTYDIDKSLGREISVLYRENDNSFGIYTQGLGMILGVIKK
jgi:hypothetical protein